jgi:hypothetical protein
VPVAGAPANGWTTNPGAIAGAAGVAGIGALIGGHLLRRSAQKAATRSAMKTVAIGGGAGLGLGAGYGMMRGRD